MILLYSFLGLLLIVFLHDVFNKKHTILRNFPIIGHLRYFLEKIGPELRQYLVANNREERPFDRKQRSWIYATSKGQNNLQGFGSDKDFKNNDHFFIKHKMFPTKEAIISKYNNIPSVKIIGSHRKKPYHPKSIFNVSAMSYGSLSPEAITAINKGSLLSKCYHNTGEGGFSEFHNNGADIVFQIGTGYFGCRDDQGQFSLGKLVQLVNDYPNIKMIEIKLSQGAKPGKGGILLGKKVSKEIAKSRGLKEGEDAISPSYHTAFKDVDSLLNFIEELANKTGLPVGIKLAVGDDETIWQIAQNMKEYNIGPDYIVIDGGEGGTGAAPDSFADHVSLPLEEAFSRVYKIFQKFNLTDKITFIASGKLGLPANAIKMFAMGADMVNIAREVLMSLGCIQAQRCHDNSCPTGIATQNLWKRRGLISEQKSIRVYNYLKGLNKEVKELTFACGLKHPCELNTTDICYYKGDTIVSYYNRYNYNKDIINFEKFYNDNLNKK